MNAPRAAVIPARNAEPYPRASTRTTRAPSFSAISIDPSVDPLSPTTTSPRSPAEPNALIAFETQIPIEFASFKQGITTDTSSPSSAPGFAAAAAARVAFLAFNSSVSTLPRMLLTSSLHFLPRPLSWRSSQAQFRKSLRLHQLPNPSDLSSTPSASASSGTFDALAAPGSRGRLLKVLG